MYLSCVKCSMSTKNSNIKIKHEIDGKINLYSRCIACRFKKFKTNDKEELSDY